MGLITIARGIGAAAIGYEHKVIISQVNGLFTAIPDIYYLSCNLSVIFAFNDDILYIYAILDAYSVRFQILQQRKDHALVLIVLCKTQGAEIRQTVNVVDISAEVAFHFQSTGPALESKHSLPVKPEICTPKRLWKHFGDFFIFQIFFRCQKQLGKCHS